MARQQTKKTQVGETQDDDTVAAEGQAEAEQAQTPTAEQARKESKSGSGTRYQTPNGNLITSR